MAEKTVGKIETLFCATDFSETASLALRHALSLARRHRARLVLGHVVEPMPLDPYPMPMTLPDVGTSLRKLAWERLAEIASDLAEPEILIDTRIEAGPAGPLLVEMAAKEKADLVIVGTRGLTGFKHLLLGSTAEHLVRRAGCPVLSIHPNDPEPVDVITEVILPTDLSPDAEAAAEAFLTLYPGANPPRVRLTFADPTPPYLDVLQHEMLDHWKQPDPRREDLETRMAPMAERLRGWGFEVETEIVDGDAVEAITELAAARGSDLIVMSTHGRSAIVNVLLGRTAQRIVQHARCPVLTVKPGSRS